MTARLSSRLATLIGLSLLTAAQAADEAYPPKCQPFIDTIDRCQRYDGLVGKKGWQTEFQLKIGKSGDAKEVTLREPQLPEQSKRQFLRYTSDDGTSAILFDASQFQQGLIKVGPEVSGEFAVEMRAKTTSPRLNDLSIVCDSVGGAPSFQFGGYDNTRNTLNIGTQEDGSPAVIEGDNKVLIRPNTWHRVRLEVRKNEIVGLVDGRVIARGKPAAGYDFAKKRQPLIYIYASTAVISDYKIDRPAAVEFDAEKAWKDAFVHKTRDQVMADLTALAKLLNDPEYATRQCAHDQLARAGAIAEPALRAAATTGGLEGRERAKSLLRYLGVQVEEE